MSNANPQAWRFEKGPSERERLSQMPEILTIRKHSRFVLQTNLVRSPPVENVATPRKVTEAAPPSRERFRLVFVLSVFLMAALWFGLCRELSGEWSVNEEYNFGWFVPFFAAYFFWLRWQDRPEPLSNFQCRILSLSAAAMAMVAL